MWKRCAGLLLSPALLYTEAIRHTEGVPEKGGFIVSAMYEEIRLEDLSPEEKLRGEPLTEIEVPGVEKLESLEVKMEFNPNTE